MSHEAERGRSGRWLMSTGCLCGVRCSVWTAESRWGGLVISSQWHEPWRCPSSQG